MPIPVTTNGFGAYAVARTYRSLTESPLLGLLLTESDVVVGKEGTTSLTLTVDRMGLNNITVQDITNREVPIVTNDSSDFVDVATRRRHTTTIDISHELINDRDPKYVRDYAGDHIQDNVVRMVGSMATGMLRGTVPNVFSFAPGGDLFYAETPADQITAGRVRFGNAAATSGSRITVDRGPEQDATTGNGSLGHVNQTISFGGTVTLPKIFAAVDMLTTSCGSLTPSPLKTFSDASLVLLCSPKMFAACRQLAYDRITPIDTKALLPFYSGAFVMPGTSLLVIKDINLGRDSVSFGGSTVPVSGYMLNMKSFQRWPDRAGMQGARNLLASGTEMFDASPALAALAASIENSEAPGADAVLDALKITSRDTDINQASLVRRTIIEFNSRFYCRLLSANAIVLNGEA